MSVNLLCQEEHSFDRRFVRGDVATVIELADAEDQWEGEGSGR